MRELQLIAADAAVDNDRWKARVCNWDILPDKKSIRDHVETALFKGDRDYVKESRIQKHLRVTVQTEPPRTSHRSWQVTTFAANDRLSLIPYLAIEHNRANVMTHFPFEIFGMIVDYLSPEDRVAYSLSCRLMFQYLQAPLSNKLTDSEWTKFTHRNELRRLCRMDREQRLEFTETVRNASTPSETTKDVTLHVCSACEVCHYEDCFTYNQQVHSAPEKRLCIGHEYKLVLDEDPRHSYTLARLRALRMKATPGAPICTIREIQVYTRGASAVTLRAEQLGVVVRRDIYIQCFNIVDAENADSETKILTDMDGFIPSRYCCPFFLRSVTRKKLLGLVKRVMREVRRGFAQNGVVGHTAPLTSDKAGCNCSLSLGLEFTSTTEGVPHCAVRLTHEQLHTLESARDPHWLASVLRNPNGSRLIPETSNFR